MPKRKNRSTPDIENVISDDTPIAEHLYEFRRKVYATKVGPGAVRELAEELNINLSLLRKLVSPAAIESVAKVENHTSE